MKLLKTVSLICFVLTFSSALSAQPISHQHSHGVAKLSGLILQPDAAGVPGARIIIERKGVRREIVSATDGSYEINLPKGKYKVRVKAQGFYPSKERLCVLRSDVTTKLEITLSFGEEIPHPRIVPN